MRKKFLCISVIMLLTSTLFAGCKGNKDVTKLVTIKNKQIKLYVWKQKGNSNDMLDSSNNRFTQRYPNADIEMKEVSRQQIEGLKDDDKANSPDIILLDNSLIKGLAKSNTIRPLDGFLEKNFIGSINEKALQGARYNERLYMVPNSFIDGQIVVYNKNILKNPYKAFNEIIKSKGKFDFYTDYNKFMEFFNAFGGKLFTKNGNVNFNSKEMVRTLTYLKWLRKSNNIGKASDENQIINELKDKKILEAIISLDSATQLDNKEFGYASMPIVEAAKKPLTPFYKVRGFVVGIKNMNKAKLTLVRSYLKFNLEKDLQAEFVAGKNHLTVIKTLTKDINGKSQPYLVKYKEQLNSSIPIPDEPNILKVSDVIMNEYTKFLSSKETPQQAIANMWKEYNAH